MMKQASKWILTAVAATTLCTTSAFAKRDPDVDKALKEQYPDAKTAITGSHEVNGVKVNNVKITTKDGESTAEVTEYGDFVLWGIPRGYGGAKSISRPAYDTLQGLFKGNPDDVDVYKTVNYLVDLQSGNKGFRLRYDPVGRLRDVDSQAELRAPLTKAEKDAQKVSGDEAKKAEGYAKKYMPDASIEKVSKAGGEGDFYFVDMKQKNGKDAKIVVNNNGRLLTEAEEIDRNDLPKPIADAISNAFGNDKIKNIYREELEYYQFQQKTGGGDEVTVKIRPNGDVLSISNPRAVQDEQAQQARHKESSGSSSDKKKSQ
jgi:hypothetical protein